MKCLVVDCSGDDPYNESRASVTYAHTGEVVGGAKILMKLLGVRRCLFAVSRAHLDMANQLESYTTTFSSMLRVAQVKAKYPQSEPHLLVSALFNVEINSGVPMEKTGYAVVTPILCKAVFDALGKGIPFTHTAVTVAQEALRPKTTFVLSVPLGTELGEMVSLLNLRKVKWDRLTVGGGYRAVPAEADAVITPDTEAVTLMRPRKKEKVSLVSCMGCGRCEEACPLHLLPDRLYEAVMRDDRRLADWLTYDECNGCLSCSAVCPARLPLGEAIVAYQSLPTEEVSDEA
jgi:electron transport complex protein RnfC